MSTDDKIVFTAIFVGLVLIVLVLGLSTESDAADIIKSRSPINIHHNAWVCVADCELKETEPDPQDVEYLAIVIYCEAGADYISDATRYMVGDVVLNRVSDSRYPDSIAAVLTQRAQYGRFYWTGIVWPDRAKNAAESHAVSRARDIAYNLLSGTHSELYGSGYIYQAEFRQGKDIIESDGIYFGR